MAELLDVKAVSQKLKLSRRQIFRLNSSGLIPRPVKIGGSIRWNCESIENWISLGCPDRREFEARQKVRGSV